MNPPKQRPMKLITEQIEDVRILTEEKDGKKLLYIEGVFLQSELKNRNGRMYPFEVLNREVERYNEEYVKPKRALGELGHPDGPTINLDRVSHRITSLRAEGHNFIGKAQILDTPMGNIAKSLLGEGVQLGVSSRGMGTLRERQDGIMEVGNDFTLATAADIVTDPSGPDCFVDGILEGVEWLYVDGRYVEQHIEAAKKTIEEAPARKLDEVKKAAFADFINKVL